MPVNGLARCDWLDFWPPSYIHSEAHGVGGMRRSAIPSIKVLYAPPHLEDPSCMHLQRSSTPTSSSSKKYLSWKLLIRNMARLCQRWNSSRQVLQTRLRAGPFRIYPRLQRLGLCSSHSPTVHDKCDGGRKSISRFIARPRERLLHTRRPYLGQHHPFDDDTRFAN